MKLYSQNGYGPADKVTQGLKEGLIDGVLFSPKDMKKGKVQECVSELRGISLETDIFLDPQIYVSLIADQPNIKVGHLRGSDWKYFRSLTKSELEISRTVDDVLMDYFREAKEIDLTGVITPNIYISQSFDSREAVIAKNFIRQAKPVGVELEESRPIYASLIVCSDALQDRNEFEEFLNDLTMLETPPDGFYLILADVRSDYFHTDVIANWMLLNLSLSINGIHVINGYSDIITPFLGVAGGNAGATGWWSNLRMFSMDRFSPSGGGRQPVPRYLSMALLNRITFAEKDLISEFFEEVLNGLPHDSDYDPVPEKGVEVLQSWEAIRALNERLVTNDLVTGLNRTQAAVRSAKELYANIAARGISIEDKRSRADHLDALDEALNQFEKRAELR